VTCDIFCAVVDNLGDAGVCWRLARQIAAEHGWTMRLWIDDMEPLTALRPGFDPARERQVLDGVEVCRWAAEFPDAEPAGVVIEAFACELPPRYLEAMAARSPAPVWLNLEYLSAEDWVAGCHGLASPHPTLPLNKHFFFPGFVPGTGGLIRERSLAVPPAPTFAGPLKVFLFCYDNAALPRLLDAWAGGTEAVECLVADGLPRLQVAAWLGAQFAVGGYERRGGLGLRALPFLPQAGFDELLAACDLTFVRGEDSFVRAQWAQRPFVWQIYPQADDAHHAKLESFLALHGAGLSPETAAAAAAFWRAWNGSGDVAAAWPAFRAELPALAAYAPVWAEQLKEAGTLAENLAEFCEQRL
jgi:uncharacterized repeat protein (TIGR03837 family)